MVLALGKYFTSTNGDTLKELYYSINEMNLVDMPQHSLAVRAIARNSFVDRSLSHFSTFVIWDGARIPLKIPLANIPDDVSANQHQLSLKVLASRFGEQLMILFTAILTEKRVLFLGHNMSANDVCSAVLSSVLLVSPPLSGLLKSRVFPYTNLFSLDFLQVPGYIAGATNPMFRQHTEWWDVLADLTTGEVVLSPSIASTGWTNMLSSCGPLDRDFIEGIVRGLDERADETWVRRQFELHVSAIVDSAFGDAIYPDEQTAHTAKDANHKRVTVWRTTASYREMHSQRIMNKSLGAKSPEVISRAIRMLHIRKELPLRELMPLLESVLELTHNEDDVIQVLYSLFT